MDDTVLTQRLVALETSSNELRKHLVDGEREQTKKSLQSLALGAIN
jgi:hypothetical protein